MRWIFRNLANLTLFLIAIAQQVQAEPIIEGIAGEVGHGMTLQITGQLFGTKPQASPRYWADFESGVDPSDLGLSQVWDEIHGEITGENARTRSASAFRSDVSSSSGGNGPVVKNMNSDNWYIFLKRRYAFEIEANQGPVGFNLKIIRMWPEVISGELPYGNNIHIGYQGSEEAGNGRVTNERTSVSGTLWFRYVAPFIANKWHTEEIIYRSSQIDEQDGTFNWLRNGLPVWTDRLWQMRIAERPNRYDILLFDQVANGTGPGPLWVYYDDIYMDDTWARVMLCDISLWSMCVNKEIQIPVSWNSSQLSFVVNLGGFDTVTQSLFLYVVTSEGDVNQKGYLVQRCARCPESPAQLEAN